MDHRFRLVTRQVTPPGCPWCNPNSTGFPVVDTVASMIQNGAGFMRADETVVVFKFLRVKGEIKISSPVRPGLIGACHQKMDEELRIVPTRTALDTTKIGGGPNKSGPRWKTGFHPSPSHSRIKGSCIRASSSQMSFQRLTTRHGLLNMICGSFSPEQTSKWRTCQSTPVVMHSHECTIWLLPWEMLLFDDERGLPGDIEGEALDLRLSVRQVSLFPTARFKSSPICRSLPGATYPSVFKRAWTDVQRAVLIGS
ncbi:hypothetical protein BU15DRAFT_63711 [Melanogaster broomeanus]|nr:hypothetical protein BU15DRAFT_63711 [Melanogaster broomeanus]